MILNLQSWLERTCHYQGKEEEDLGHIVQEEVVVINNSKLKDRI